MHENLELVLQRGPVQVRCCLWGLCCLFQRGRLCVRAFSVTGTLWLALVIIAIVMALDLRGAGCVVGRAMRAESEHEAEWKLRTKRECRPERLP